MRELERREREREREKGRIEKKLYIVLGVPPPPQQKVNKYAIDHWHKYSIKLKSHMKQDSIYNFHNRHSESLTSYCISCIMWRIQDEFLDGAEWCESNIEYSAVISRKQNQLGMTNIVLWVGGGGGEGYANGHCFAQRARQLGRFVKTKFHITNRENGAA